MPQEPAPDGSSDSARTRLQVLLDQLGTDRRDADAWRALYLLTWPRVVGVVFRLLRGQRDLTEDLGQEVFLRLLRLVDFQSLSDPDDFLAYLRTMARNVTIDHLRQSHRFLYAELTPEEYERWWSDADGMPDEALQAAQTRRMILSRLTTRERALADQLLKGYSPSDIAHEAGWSAVNCRVQVHRLRAKVSKILAGNQGGPPPDATPVRPLASAK